MGLRYQISLHGCLGKGFLALCLHLEAFELRLPVPRASPETANLSSVPELSPQPDFVGLGVWGSYSGGFIRGMY